MAYKSSLNNNPSGLNPVDAFSELRENLVMILQSLAKLIFARAVKS
jgi:hypothetical protein